MPNVNQIIIGVVVIALVGGGIFLFATGKITPTEDAEEQETVVEVFSIAGRVTSVNVEENSFMLLRPREEVESVVRIGARTDFIRLVFPFDITNPPEGATFTPERQPVVIENLQVNDQVFVRSSHVVKSGEDVVDPSEVQILP